MCDEKTNTKYYYPNTLSVKQEYPVIIKPATLGSSIGIFIANNEEEFQKYSKEAFLYDKKIVVQKYEL